MRRTIGYAWLTAVYLPILLAVTLLVGVTVSQWLVVVFILLVSLAIFAWLEYRQYGRTRDLQELTGHIQFDQWVWRQLERDWIGRQVRLKEDIRNPKEPVGLQVYVRAGSVGTIVALNRDERAPFTVLFPGFAHRVVVRLDKLDLNPTLNHGRTYDAA